MIGDGGAFYGYDIEIGNYCTNISISNNLICGPISGYYALSSSSSSSISLLNNVINFRSLNGSAGINAYNSIIENNIVCYGEFEGTGNVVKNNVCNETQFGTANGNQQNVDMTTVFVGTGSTDGKWQLKDGSPAKGAGTNGIDIGAFGGQNPYMLSGIPPIPTIYEVISPTVGTQQTGLPVQVKAKSNN